MDSPFYAVLKQDGTGITGTVGTSENRQMAIKDVRLDGNSLSFTAENPQVLLKADWVLTSQGIGETLEIERDGHVRKATVSLKKKD